MRTRWETAEARLEGVIANMDDRLIRAPFTGILGFRKISEGSLVTPNTVITTLDDISTIKLDFNVAEVYLAQLANGQTIKANSIVYRGQAFEGIVTSVGSRVDTSTRSVQVRAEIENSTGLQRPGMLLTVDLTLNPRDAIVVPEAAVVLVVFLVLAAQFESFVHPLVIMTTVPLAIFGALIGWLLTDGTLNIYTNIGLIIFVGIASKNAS